MKPYQTFLLLCCQCNIHARWSSAVLCRELLNMSQQLQQLYLLAKCNYHKHHCHKNAYRLSAAARWTLVGPLIPNQHACRSLPLNPACTLVCLFYICHTCWCGASLQVMLLVWCLIIGHTLWCGASYRLCLLLWCLTIVMSSRCGAS